MKGDLFHGFHKHNHLEEYKNIFNKDDNTNIEMHINIKQSHCLNAV